MKTILLSVTVLAALSFSSCRKERTCTCKETSTTNGVGSTSTSEETNDRVTKREAKRLSDCYSYKSSDSQTYGGTTYVTETVVECELD